MTRTIFENLPKAIFFPVHPTDFVAYSFSPNCYVPTALCNRACTTCHFLSQREMAAPLRAPADGAACGSYCTPPAVFTYSRRKARRREGDK